MPSAWPTRGRRPAAPRRTAALAALALAAGCATAPPPEPPPPQNVFLLLPDPDGGVGSISVTNDAGSVTVDAPGQAVAVRDAATAPEPPRPLPPAEVGELFGAALEAAPEPPLHFTFHFEQGSTDLTAASRDELPRALAAIRARGSVDTSVVGHTDTLGSSEDNVRLSLERARAVAALLEEAGVDPAVLEITSHGEENLLVPTADEVAEPRNRRVEVTVR